VATRGCSLVILEVQWSVGDRGSYGWVLEDCSPWCYPMSLVVLGQIQIVVHIEELHLVLRIVVVTRSFPRVDYRWWPIVGGASRHSWQQRSIYVIIKGCRIKKHLEEDVNVGLTVGVFIKVMDFKSLHCCMLYLSSPYLLVFGDDHVICYMGADDVARGAGET